MIEQKLYIAAVINTVFFGDQMEDMNNEIAILANVVHHSMISSEPMTASKIAEVFAAPTYPLYNQTMALLAEESLDFLVREDLLTRSDAGYVVSGSLVNRVMKMDNRPIRILYFNVISKDNYAGKVIEMFESIGRSSYLTALEVFEKNYGLTPTTFPIILKMLVQMRFLKDESSMQFGTVYDLGEVVSLVHDSRTGIELSIPILQSENQVNQTNNQEVISTNEALVVEALSSVPNADVSAKALILRIVAGRAYPVPRVEIATAASSIAGKPNDDYLNTLSEMVNEEIMAYYEPDTVCLTQHFLHIWRAVPRQDRQMTESERLMSIAAGDHTNAAIELQALYLRVIGRWRDRNVNKVMFSDISNAVKSHPDSYDDQLRAVENKLRSLGLIQLVKAGDDQLNEQAVAFTDEAYVMWWNMRSKDDLSSGENTRHMREGLIQQPWKDRQRREEVPPVSAPPEVPRNDTLFKHLDFVNYTGKENPNADPSRAEESFRSGNQRKDILDASITVFGLPMSVTELRELVAVVSSFFGLVLSQKLPDQDGFEHSITYRGQVIDIARAYTLIEQIEMNPFLASAIGPRRIIEPMRGNGPRYRDDRSDSRGGYSRDGGRERGRGRY